MSTILDTIFKETFLGSLIADVINFAKYPTLDVTEKDNVVHIKGIPSHVIKNDISDIYRTNRIGKNIFIHLGSRDLKIHSFFVPDIMIILQKLLDDPTGRTSTYTLNRILKKINTNTWAEKLSEETVPEIDYKKINNTLIYKPLPHQQEFLEFYDDTHKRYNLKGQLLAAAAGGGKTFNAIALAEGYYSDQIVVFCPKPALYRPWVNSVSGKDSLYKKDQSFWVSDSKTLYTGKEKYIIANYEAMGKVIDRMGKLKGKRVTVILDESHNLNELTAKRTILFTEFVDRLKPDNVLLLSGTPIKAFAIESIPLLRTVDPLFTKDVEEVFKKVYKGNNTGAVELLRKRLGIVSFTVEKKELKLLEPKVFNHKIGFVGSDHYTLPEIGIRMKAYVEDRTKFYKERREKDLRIFNDLLERYEKQSIIHEVDYHTYRTDLKEIMESNSYNHLGDQMARANTYEKQVIMPSLPKALSNQFRDIKSQVKYPKLKIMGEVLGRVLSKARIDCNTEIARHIPYQQIVESSLKKTVVFTNNIKVAEEALKQCDKFTSPLGVYGSTTKDLAKIVDRFATVDENNVLVTTYASLSTATHLADMADQIIFIDVPYREYILNQATSRVHRLGQDSTPKFHYALLVTEELNIHSRSVDILEWAKAQVEEITGVESPLSFEPTVSKESIKPIYEEW